MMTLAITGLGQTANFNFSSSTQSISGWTNVKGDPGKGVRTATASGITVSSVATGNWAPDGNGNCAYDGGGTTTAGFFPAGVMGSTWYQYGTTNASLLNVSQPQLKISGLHTGSVYSIRMSGAFDFVSSSLMMDPALYTVMGAGSYGTQQVNGNQDVSGGAVFNNVVPDSTGTIRIYINTGNGSNVACIAGLQVLPNVPLIGNLTPGAGLAQLGSTLALGDSVTGQGPHSFTSNRYEHLNGYQYSFGGSVNDPVNHPVMRLYDNGAFAVGLTMDQSLNAEGDPGMRYFPKAGLLQLGGSDKIDTTTANSSGPAIDINTDAPNTLKGVLYGSILGGDGITVDTLTRVGESIVYGENHGIHGSMDHSAVFGFGNTVGASVSDVLISGGGNQLQKPTSADDDISGFLNVGVDTARGSLIGGAQVTFGGLWQFVCGIGLANRTPGGAAVGSFNVDFSSLPYTGTQGLATPNLGGYPLFAVGNGSGSAGARSNALTVLYNGRTQINTTGGLTGSLTQAAVTPQAALDVVSTNTGVLLPRLTTSQRNGIATADLQNGLLLYNTDSSVFQYYNGGTWSTVGGSGGGARWLAAGGSIYDSLDNIGIGTSNTQGYKLAVNGNAIFTRVVIKPQANWPDYVFDKQYKLLALQEVEQYIHRYHHLPGVASADEVKKTGIDVETQQAALLKKVEELTLYVIDLDKRVNGLKAAHRRLLADNPKNHGQKTK